MIDISQGLEPGSPFGYGLLIIGSIFSAGCIYVMSNLNEDSIEDQKRKILKEKERAQKIARLYPKSE